MKIVFRGLFVLSTILLLINLGYLYKFMSNLNLITFLILVVLLPNLLFSICIASLATDIKFKNNISRLMSLSGLSLIFTLIIYQLLNKTSSSMAAIIENTKLLNKTSDSISLSNISYENGTSSYIFMLLLNLTLIFVFTILFNKLKEKINVRKSK